MFTPGRDAKVWGCVAGLRTVLDPTAGGLGAEGGVGWVGRRVEAGAGGGVSDSESDSWILVLGGGLDLPAALLVALGGGGEEMEEADSIPSKESELSPFQPELGEATGLGDCQSSGREEEEDSTGDGMWNLTLAGLGWGGEADLPPPGPGL